jgi:hypothetical protein
MTILFTLHVEGQSKDEGQGESRHPFKNSPLHFTILVMPKLLIKPTIRGCVEVSRFAHLSIYL